MDLSGLWYELAMYFDLEETLATLNNRDGKRKVHISECTIRTTTHDA